MPARGNITIRPVRIEDMRGNGYDPNRMIDDEVAEPRAEIQRQRGVPKPIVANPGEGGYDVAGGEPCLEAAQNECHAEDPCEVIEADEFEAMDLLTVVS
ncbi:MAG TPA: ParB/RepB/Spo0J family partition protein [Gemmataceae bacterium]|nr:ParB/RepB/Spo0J family partition protein [Gemmataceae bacterium]